MKSWQTGVTVGMLFTPLSIVPVGDVTGGAARLSRSPASFAVIAVSIAVAWITAGRISAGQRSQEQSSPASAVIGGFLAGGLSLAFMWGVFLVAAVVYFENSHFTW